MRHPACALRWLALLLVVLTWASPAWARDGTVTLNDGRKFTGEVVSDDEKGVTLRISGISTAFPRADVKGLELTQTIQEQYAERRAKIAEDDLQSRYGLAYWLYERRAYDLAQREVAAMQKQFPGDESVLRLKASIDQKLMLLSEQARAAKNPLPAKAASGAPGAPGSAAGAAGAKTRPGVAQPARFPLLTEEQVNAIRLYEIEPADRPRVEVPPEAIDILFRDYSTSDLIPKGKQERVDFRRLPGYEQLKIIFALKARELYPMVRVYDDPPVIASYRQIQQRYVMNYCAAANCHGGTAGGDFLLSRDERNAERALYTNYYILYQSQSANGYMIDLDQPDRSYLLQFGLPREAAATPHPQVRGYQSLFRGPDDANYLRVRSWIAGLVRPRQRYPIEYTLPTADKLAPATGVPAPAPRPAPTTAPAPTPVPATTRPAPSPAAPAPGTTR